MVRRHIYFKLMLRTYSEQERKEEAMDAAAYSQPPPLLAAEEKMDRFATFIKFCLTEHTFGQ
jgi:hypothetical protein